MKQRKPLFPLGQVVATSNALARLGEVCDNPQAAILPLLGRHQSGDWGTVCKADAQANEWAVKNGERVLSAYVVEGVKLYVITERDRSATTVLLPEDY